MIAIIGLDNDLAFIANIQCKDGCRHGMMMQKCISGSRLTFINYNHRPGTTFIFAFVLRSFTIWFRFYFTFGQPRGISLDVNLLLNGNQTHAWTRSLNLRWQIHWMRGLIIKQCRPFRTIKVTPHESNVSNHQQLEYLFKSLKWLIEKKTSISASLVIF